MGNNKAEVIHPQSDYFKKITAKNTYVDWKTNEQIKEEDNVKSSHALFYAFVKFVVWHKIFW